MKIGAISHKIAAYIIMVGISGSGSRNTYSEASGGREGGNSPGNLTGVMDFIIRIYFR